MLLLRVHAGADVGSGHGMRCLALAQAWRNSGGAVVFVMRDCGPAFRRRLSREEMPLEIISGPAGGEEDLRHTLASRERLAADWIVLDGYCFTSDYQAAVARSGAKLLVVDDCGDLGPYHGDILLNNNLHARAALYTECLEHMRLLLGTRFALLREEFLRQAAMRRTVRSPAGNVLVTLGGSDPTNVTPKVVEALRLLGGGAGLQITILAGETNRHFDDVKSAVEKSELHVDLRSSADDMAALYNWADMVIGAGGISCWERALLGVPSLVITLAENQQPIVRELASAGAAVELGPGEGLRPEHIAEQLGALLEDAPRREEIARRGRELVDGQGAARIAMHMLGEKLFVREARPEDRRMLWQWVNDPVVRGMSLTGLDHIPWETHVEWFEGKLAEENCLLLVAIDADDVPIGQARFDIEGRVATISISIARDSRGKGRGTSLIRIALARLFTQTDVREVIAQIRPHNKASRGAFEHCGFVDCGPRRVGEVEIRHYELRETE